MTCREVDELITPFIDGECADAERAALVSHLQICQTCRRRADAESTAKQVLHAHAAVARTMGVAPAWRPRVFRLGQPALPVRAGTLAAVVAVAGAALVAAWLRPPPVVAVGIIGDSICAHEHRFTARFNVGERECTLGCVKVGAEFVLVTDTQIYRIDNQQLPELASLASRRVQIKGKLDGDRIVVASMSATSE
jgi:putative zinc finger protein